jgi:hypothetical protein
VAFRIGAFLMNVPRFTVSKFTAVAVQVLPRSVLDLTATDTLIRCFTGGFSDAAYGKIAPYQRCLFCGGAAFHVHRFSTGAVLDFAITDVMLKGFAGRFSDGSYGCLVPFWSFEVSGKVLQFTLSYFMTGAVPGLTASCPGSHPKGLLAQMFPWRIQ